MKEHGDRIRAVAAVYEAQGLSKGAALLLALEWDRREFERKRELRARFAELGDTVGAASRQAGAVQWDTYRSLQGQAELNRLNGSVQQLNNTLRQQNRGYGGMQGYSGPSY